ncbi:MAG: hypothetical protein RL483_13 [Pseudomonadota bacterium]
MSWLLHLLVGLCLSAGVSAAWGHSSSTSLLEIRSAGADRFSSRLDLPLRDLALTFRMDQDGDGQIRWSEVLAQKESIDAWVRQGVAIRNDQGDCPWQGLDWAVASHGEEVTLSLVGELACESPRQTDSARLVYRLFFDQDSLHRALFKSDWSGQWTTGVLSPDRPEAWLSPSRTGFWGNLTAFLVEGVWHIWIGADHIAFLLSLLLPCVLLQRLPGVGRWQSQPAFGVTLRRVLVVVTAFTLAHSVTLGLAATGLVSLPDQLVESVIAGSVVAAALMNLVGRGSGLGWQMAFGFGLVHGFGFANVLGDLGLSTQGLVSGLLGFNLGVELGQLAIVAVFVPLAWWLRSTAFYQVGVMGLGSMAIAGAGVYWLWERLS